MKYCANAQCDSKTWFAENYMFCEECGTELTPCIRCQTCWRNESGNYNHEFNPRLLQKHCTGCGQALTDAFLSQCMKMQLQGMVN
jgi:hypothetical protein